MKPFLNITITDIMGLKMSVLYPQALESRTEEIEVSTSSLAQLFRSESSNKGRGDCHAVYDGTNPAIESPLPLLHPACVRAQDVVHARCHLILRASTSCAPALELHLDSLTMLAISPMELPSSLDV